MWEKNAGDQPSGEKKGDVFSTRTKFTDPPKMPPGSFKGPDNVPLSTDPSKVVIEHSAEYLMSH